MQRRNFLPAHCNASTPLNEAPSHSEPVAAEPSQPSVVILDTPQTSSWAASGLLLLAVLTLLYLARELVLPIVMALILNLVFLPVVRRMKKLWIPAPLGAALVVLGLLATFVGGIYNLAEPAGSWLDRAPQSLRVIDTKIRRLTGSVQNVATVTARVEDITERLANAGNDNNVQEVVVKSESLAGTVLGTARGFAVTAISTLVLLYFLLASGDMFLRKTIAVTPRLSDKKRAVDIAHQVESAVSNYLLTVSMINVGLGSAVALAMYLLGVPNPVLWGVMVALFNFVPYVGDLASITVLSVVGLLSFDDPWHSVSVPAAFYLLTAIEGYLVTPLIVGRRLSLNPVVIVISVLFWGWMWGIPGALLAVPILVTLKTLCERVESLQVFGEFLSD
jgi:predicted PurR-regulated permease PerM